MASATAGARELLAEDGATEKATSMVSVSHVYSGSSGVWWSTGAAPGARLTAVTSDDARPDVSAKLAEIPVPVWDDFKPGVAFRDILPTFAHHDHRSAVVADLTQWCEPLQPNVIVGIDARGFLLGPLVADRLEVGFVPIRKAGKTPGPCIQTEIVGEYATDTLELRSDLITAGASVIVIDDLVATGGSMLGAKELVQEAGASVVGFAAFVDLPGLGGSSKLAPVPFHACLSF